MEHLATQAFSNHQIKKSSDKSYELSRKTPVGWSSKYFVEFVSLNNGSLYIGGDVEPCIFSYHSGSLLDRIQWVSDSSVEYLAEKLTLGLKDPLLSWDIEGSKKEVAPRIYYAKAACTKLLALL